MNLKTFVVNMLDGGYVAIFFQQLVPSQRAEIREGTLSHSEHNYNIARLRIQALLGLEMPRGLPRGSITYFFR